MRQKQFLRLVEQEVENIKKYTPKEVLEQLTVNDIVPNNATYSIYSKLTSKPYYSVESIHLTKKCATVYYINLIPNSTNLLYTDLDRDAFILADELAKTDSDLYTGLEVYICMKHSSIDKLISYLKDELVIYSI